VVELVEPVVPADVLQPVRAGPAGEVDAQDTRLTLPRALHGRRLAVVFLDPAADGVVVGRRTRLRSHAAAVPVRPAHHATSDGQRGHQAGGGAGGASTEAIVGLADRVGSPITAS